MTLGMHCFASFDKLAEGLGEDGQAVAEDEDGTLWKRVLLSGKGVMEPLVQ